MSNAANKVWKLLFIDSSEWMHRLVRNRLSTDQLEMMSAFTGADGINLTRAEKPDVILLDSDLSDMSGIECLTSLKQCSESSGIPVIYASATDEPLERVNAFDRGAHDFVMRPFEFLELGARINVACRMQGLIYMLAQRAQLDGLTGLWNRAYFNTRLAAEHAESRRYQRPTSLIMTDVDRFKSINDRYGHPFGDTVLVQFAALLAGSRVSDVACRYGGEEFALILPGVSIPEAHEVADRIRTNLMQLCWPKQHDLQVTASFGVAGSESLSQSSPWEELVECADAALYAAKRRGRNQVVSAPGLSFRATG